MNFGKNITNSQLQKINIFVNNLNKRYNLILQPLNILYNSKPEFITDFSYSLLQPDTEKNETKEDTKIIENQYYDTTEDTENANFNDLVSQYPLYKPNQININKNLFYHLDDPKAIQDIKQNIIGQLNEVKEKVNNQFCFRETNTDFEILNHQKIVQRYLNIYTPYRGLLLYHGLGSGKTCSSISILEGMKKQNNIFIITPASLQQNYKTQLSFCGDKIFKYNNNWEFYAINQSNQTKSINKIISMIKNYLYLNNITNLKKIIIENKGFWFIKNGDSNFDSLNNQSKKQISNQIKILIESKYHFINYNGINIQKYKKIYQKNSNHNPFNNSTVVIDEAHNLVNRIINKLNGEENIDTSSTLIYEDLMKAENCKVVALTGTPFVNNPCEIGVLMNIIIGYLNVFEFKLKKIYNSQLFKKIFGNDPYIDLIEYNASDNLLSITKNPYFFTNENNQLKYQGKIKNYNNTDFKKKLIKILNDNKIQISNSFIKLYKPLPDIINEFNKKFIKNINGENIINNKELLQYKLLGRVSFFGDKKSLMPKLIQTDDLNDIHIVESVMSNFQTNQYKKISNKSKNKDSKYKIFSRSSCNFTFLDDDNRPLPSPNITSENEDDIDDTDYKKDLSLFINKFNDPNFKNKYFFNDLPKFVNHNFIRDKDNELTKFSSKYYNILKNILNSDGCQLLYSNFITVEGIGIMSKLLKYQGFFQLNITKKGTSYDINLESDYNQNQYYKTDHQIIKKKVFAIYTGEEDSDIKEIIRNLYNSNTEKLPPEIISRLTELFGPKYYDNKYGDIIQIIMISASGAEGIDLKNTNYVHITEPYWQNVRIQQVIGRARRICSHSTLPQEKQFVKVFLYLSIMNKQESKLTADQTLHNIMMSKKKLSDSFLNTLKEVAIDCKNNCYKEPKGNKIRIIEKNINDVMQIKKKIKP